MVHRTAAPVTSSPWVVVVQKPNGKNKLSMKRRFQNLSVRSCFSSLKPYQCPCLGLALFV